MPSQFTAQLLEKVKALACPEKAKGNARFSKTGEGEYAQGDVYIGVSVPQLRGLVKKHPPAELSDILDLLKNTYHEVRLLALLLMVKTYKKSPSGAKEEIFQAYLAHTVYINNWDLVDASCYHIVGPHLYGKDTQILFKLSQSSSIWERRIAIVSTYFCIRKEEFDTTFSLVELMLKEKQDIVQKAMGWMVKEISKRDVQAATAFLDSHGASLPRTSLRIAIEKLPEKVRKHYLAAKG